MKGELRREEIKRLLSLSDKPVSAGSLAETFGITRQSIVKDISILREEGIPIQSHIRGYVLDAKLMPERVFKLIHTDEEVEEELNTIVDLGGVVRDVFVYHKYYNKVTATLDIKSRLDVKNYIDNIKAGKSLLLKNVTSGYHYHTVAAERAETLLLIEEKLRERGFLARLQEYEPDEMWKK